MPSGVVEWVFSSPYNWTPLRASELASPPPDGLVEKGFRLMAGGETWNGYWKGTATSAYEYCLLLSLHGTYQLVWCLNTPDYFDWLSRYAVVPAQNGGALAGEEVQV
jgi:hypothetical protein